MNSHTSIYMAVRSFGPLFVLLFLTTSAAAADRPNIAVIMVDDK